MSGLSRMATMVSLCQCSMMSNDNVKVYSWPRWLIRCGNIMMSNDSIRIYSWPRRYKQRIDYCLSSSSLSVCMKKLITVAKIITDIIITSFIVITNKT